jgi:hypothetical protein
MANGSVTIILFYEKIGPTYSVSQAAPRLWHAVLSVWKFSWLPLRFLKRSQGLHRERQHHQAHLCELRGIQSGTGRQ